MAHLRRRIAERWLDGHETDRAERLLENFEVSMCLMTKHRQQIVEGLDGSTRFTRVEFPLETIIAKIKPVFS
jgi:hypothetical protein